MLIAEKPFPSPFLPGVVGLRNGKPEEPQPRPINGQLTSHNPLFMTSQEIPDANRTIIGTRGVFLVSGAKTIATNGVEYGQNTYMLSKSTQYIQWIRKHSHPIPQFICPNQDNVLLEGTKMRLASGYFLSLPYK